MTDVLLGVLAGGRGTRMGGRDKSRLPAPDTGEALAARIVRLARAAGLECVMVGGTPLPGVAQLTDDPPGIGPIGGLCALLDHAGSRPAVAVACDLPRVTAELLQRITHETPKAPVLAPRDPATGKWQPLFARYDAARVLPALRAAVASDTRSMQTVLRSLDVHELALSPAERAALQDWDSPDDLAESV